MKISRFNLVYITILLLAIICVVFSACGEKELIETQTSYTIQYTDDNGSHTFTVDYGYPYSLETLPSREGYTFDGLFDAEVGGTKYVSALGSSLSVYNDKKNLVLFAQFKPLEYTLALDFQGADVVGERQFTVGYGQQIPELPIRLTLEHSVFSGWYTQPECKGVQVADKYGNLPVVSTINNNNFDLTADLIFLYAGFEPETYTVTFYNEDGESEEMDIAYNTPIKNVVPDFRNDGKAVLSWSKVQNDTALTAVFTGKVTDDLVLYAAEWAPIIEFDANGGKEVSAIIAKEGSRISLPTPVRTDYTFAGWFTKGGEQFTTKTMPADSEQLTARWNAQLIFDTNGGTAVSNISEPVGTKITLPATEKDSYIFAGWYVGNEKYESTSMPLDSFRLQAKYWKIENQSTVVLSETTPKFGNAGSTASMSYSVELDLGTIYKAGVRAVKVTAHFDGKVPGSRSAENPGYVHMWWYSKDIASDAYLVWKYSETVTKGATYMTFSEHTDLALTGEKLFVCMAGGYTTGMAGIGINEQSTFKNFWVEVEYPDMTTLY